MENQVKAVILRSDGTYQAGDSGQVVPGETGKVNNLIISSYYS